MTRYGVVVSGTRYGMTPEQTQTAARLVDSTWLTDFHHGDCVGVDAEVCEMVAAKTPKPRIHKHPALVDDRWRANTPIFDVQHNRIKPLDRNLRMVSMSDMLWAFPKSMHDQAGGTWYTIRAANRLGLSVVIVAPDGVPHLDTSVDTAPSEPQ